MLAALAAAALAGPTTAAERRYSVTSFDRIEVDGPFQVTLLTGRPNSATATGSQQALDGVSLEVQSRILRIRPDRSSSWANRAGEEGGPVAIAVTTHELKSAAVAGSGSIAIDKAKAMKFDLSLAGSGRISLGNIDADVLHLGLVGSGKITIGGKAKTLKALLQGGGDLDAEKLKVEDAEINADTAGAVSVAVRRAAKVTSTGAGDTRIIGSPACTVEARGAGRVLCSK